MFKVIITTKKCRKYCGSKNLSGNFYVKGKRKKLILIQHWCFECYPYTYNPSTLHQHKYTIYFSKTIFYCSNTRKMFFFH